MSGNILNNIKNYLEGSSIRHKTLMDNVAKSNKPGAKAQDFDPTSYMRQSSSSIYMNLAKTNPSHMTGVKMPAPQAFAAGDSWGTKPNGNNIHNEQQAHKISRNAERYKAAAKAYGSIFDMLSTSLGGGR
jgi:flagellar basal body rod protein FlgB